MLALRAQNPAVIAAQTDPDWIPLTDQITQRYFGGDDSAMAAEVQEVEVNMDTVIAAVVLAGITLIMTFLNGNLIPGVVPPRVQRACGAPPPPGPAGNAIDELADALTAASEMIERLRDAMYVAGAHQAANGEGTSPALDAWRGSGRFSQAGIDAAARADVATAMTPTAAGDAADGGLQAHPVAAKKGAVCAEPQPAAPLPQGGLQPRSKSPASWPPVPGGPRQARADSAASNRSGESEEEALRRRGAAGGPFGEP